MWKFLTNPAVWNILGSYQSRTWAVLDWKCARSSSALRLNWMGAGWKGGKITHLCMFQRAPLVSQRFLPFCISMLFHNRKHLPREPAGSLFLPSWTPRNKTRGLQKPHGKPRRGGSPVPSLQAGFCSTNRLSTQLSQASPPWDHIHLHQLIHPCSVIRNCLFRCSGESKLSPSSACWVLTLQNLNIWSPKTPVTQFWKHKLWKYTRGNVVCQPLSSGGTNSSF